MISLFKIDFQIDFFFIKIILNFNDLNVGAWLIKYNYYYIEAISIWKHLFIFRRKKSICSIHLDKKFNSNWGNNNKLFIN